jgi:hypothetical protein
MSTDDEIRHASWKAYTDTLENDPSATRQLSPGETAKVRAYLRTLTVPVIRQSRRLTLLDIEDPACPVPKTILETHLRWHDAELKRRGL